MLTLLTCTGDRPALFRRQERWMARQSFPWTNWLVVDDGLQATNCTLGQHHIRLSPGPRGVESFTRNLQVGLTKLVSNYDAGFVFFIEDDDWYGQDYLASLFIALTSHDLAGESHSRYYNVSEGSYFFCQNAQHAALCATACRSRLIPQILSLIDPVDPRLDLRIWTQLNCSKHLQQSRHCVGLKGQTGRPGLTWAHRSQDRFQPDLSGQKLKQWLGDDAEEALKGARQESWHL